jgi:hypothetical protein
MTTLKAYLPLAVVVLLAIVMSWVLQHDADHIDSMRLMNTSMGFFLCLLAMLKLFNLSGFADGFQMYDVVAKRSRIYAYVYPFIELGLGLSFLGNFAPFATNVVMIAIMALGLIGVVKSISSGMNIKCACLGTALNVPLSTVSIVENVGTGLMACINLAML